MITKEQKRQLVEELTEKLRQAGSRVFGDYRGLSVAAWEVLRRRLRALNSSAQVVKTSLLARALKNLGWEIKEEYLSRPLVIFFGQDEVATVKTIVDFTKEQEKLELLGGWSDGQYIEASDLAVLADLPSRETLQVRLIGSLSNLLHRLVYTLSGNQRKLVIILSNFRKE